MALAWIDDRLISIDSKLTRNSGWRRAVLILHVWIARHRGRKALARLEPHRLADIAIDRDDASIEAARPFWQGQDALSSYMENEL
ncbi:MAG: DUF1127 domain-containing protein [Geminicoccaceae bacterium]